MIRVIATGLVLGTLLSGVEAQVGWTFDSIEGLLAMADRACVGRVASIEPAKEKSGLRPLRIRLQVTEWIRGGTEKTLEVLVEGAGSGQDVKAMLDRHVEVMLTIGPRAPNHHAYSLLRLDGKEVAGKSCYFRLIEPIANRRGSSQASTDQYDSGRIFDINLEVVSSRRQFVERARTYQKKHPEALPYLWLQLPNSFLNQVGESYPFGGIHLPVCNETRGTLVRLLKNPESVLSRVAKADHASERRLVLSAAMRVLEPFKDIETLGLVRRFAQNGDPPSNPPKGQKAGGYDVRREAQSLLERWAGRPK